MAGINANFNRGINFGGLNQAGVAKNEQQAKNEKEFLIQKDEPLDSFVKTNNELQEAKKEDDKPQKSDGGNKKDKKSFGDYLNKHLNKCGGAENLTRHNDPEATAAGAFIVAFFDWAIHGFQ